MGKGNQLSRVCIVINLRIIDQDPGKMLVTLPGIILKGVRDKLLTEPINAVDGDALHDVDSEPSFFNR